MRKILPLLFALVLSTVGFGQIANKSSLFNKKSTSVLLKADPDFRKTGNSQKYREVDVFTELTYYDDDIDILPLGLGETSEININSIIYLPLETVAKHTGEILNKVSFFVANTGTSKVNSLSVRIWTDTSDINNPAYEQEVANVEDGWNEVRLTTPYKLGTEPIFLGYHLVGVGYVVGAESNATKVEPNGYGDIIELGGLFGHLSENNFGDLAIKAYVGTPDTVALKLESIDIGDSVEPDSIDVVGTVKNEGLDTITSYDVTYILNGDTSSVYSVSGVSIPFNSTHQFKHDVKADLTETGTYELKVIISNVNNSDKEVNLNDNVLSKNIISIVEIVQKVVLHELFTSSTCPPCAIYNPVIDDVVYNKNVDKATLIKYQVNWPEPGDPYYIPEAGERVKYYEVSGVPSFVVDGNTIPPDYRQEILDKYAAAPALLKMNNGLLNYNFDTKSLTADIDIIALSSVSGNLVAQMAVVEKKTTGNIGSNGETEFHNVMMKFMNSTNGNPLANFATRDTQHLSVTTNLSNANIEEITDIRVIVWVQDYDTKEVFQSSYIDLTQEDMIDVGFKGISTVNSACGLPSDAEVKVSFVNNGLFDVSNFKLKYLVNGEQAQEYDYTGTLAPGEEAEVVFNQDFSQKGNYKIEVVCELEKDVVNTNNKIEKFVANVTPVDAAGYTEDFSEIPLAWSLEDANGDYISWLYVQQEGYGHEDASSFVYRYNPDEVTAANDYLYSTCIDFEVGKTYELSFWYRVGEAQYPEKLKVFIGDAPDKSAMTQQIVDLGTISNVVYENSKARFQVPADGTYYIGFHAYSDPNQWLLLVDDIAIGDVTATIDVVDEVNIYPNPTNGLLRVEGVQGAEVVVYNIVGEIVYSNSNAFEDINIDLSSRKEGSYLVKITNDDKVSIHKIVVTK